ncbi:MAG: UDP-N-acetylmuramyl-tripeptide synthetase [Candidatus Yonathbacteria bacterium]|nr:UDP-N-acetylmuramyl-tripeptide synthetase [Candidatus Yonathbacteria bacterium]
MLDDIFRTTKKIIPHRLFVFLQPAYHYALACAGAIIYRFPSRTITVIAVTGTKGKTTTVELLNAILEKNGAKTALSSTLRFKIGERSRPNMYKMSLPGRFFLQRFLRQAVNAGCSHAIVEITSEAAKQYRHKFVALDALIFTNLAPEHIESHGSFEKYADAKLSIGRALVASSKRPRIIVANIDDPHGKNFLDLSVDIRAAYGVSNAPDALVSPDTIVLSIGSSRTTIRQGGAFNLMNILAAITYARAAGISDETIASGLSSVGMIRGRMEHVDEGQSFTVIVDYAHTPDSLKAAYGAYPDARKICVLGGTGGGRDTWKRPEMGTIADTFCSHIILTDEDPYDEDPRCIVEGIEKGIKKTPCEIIMDRKAAITRACELAQPNDVVYITGKGTDPYIMGKNGEKTPWDDATVARDVLHTLL